MSSSCFGKPDGVAASYRPPIPTVVLMVKPEGCAEAVGVRIGMSAIHWLASLSNGCPTEYPNYRDGLVRLFQFWVRLRL